MVDREAATASPGCRPPAPRPRSGLLLLLEGEVGTPSRAVAIDGEVTIGRSPDCTISLDDAAASRCHVKVTATRAGVISISDLGSSNGTWVNGARVGIGPCPLSQGNVLRVGSSVLMVVQDIEGHEPLQGAPLIGGKWARSVWEFVQRFAPAPIAILILGETGTGKEVVARAIHEASGRKGPLIAVNCAAFTESLAESQLFGHRRGAFSGATDHQQGFFAAAHQGTLFLDEVGELTPMLQAKLLRAIESGEVTALGATSPTKVDVRLLSATSRDLREAASRDAFRGDLFHRLCGISHWLAPLRERREEIVLLAAHLLRASQEGLSIAAEALELLLLHSWPGNVRELRQVLSTAAVAARDRSSSRVEACDLSHLQGMVAADEHSQGSKQAPELAHVVAALRRFGGNVSQAARFLGAHRAQIYRILEANQLRSEDFRPT